MADQSAQKLRAKRHGCDRCSKSFARPEHLMRHVRTHTRENSFHCSICGKGFSRHDVLIRHSQSHDSESLDGRAAAFPRACLSCAARRVRCPRGLPCKNCSKKNLQCSYPATNMDKGQMIAEPSQQATATCLEEAASLCTVQSEHDSPDGNATASNVSDIYSGSSEASQRVGQATHGNGIYESPNVAENNQILGQDTSVDLFEGQSLPNGPSIVNQRRHGHDLDIDYSLNYQVQSLSSINWMTPDFQPALGWNLLLGDPQSNMESNAGLPDSGMPIVMEPGTSGTYGDFLPETYMQIDPRLPQIVPGLQDRDHPMPNSLGSIGSTTDSTASHQTENRLYVESEGARAPNGHARHEQSPNNTELNSNQHYYGTSDGVCRVSVEQYISRQSYDAFIYGLQVEAQVFHWSVDTGALPTQVQLETWTRAYFEKFHHSFPFLRRVSFLTGTNEDWMLILAVAATGACSISNSEANKTRTLLLDLLQEVLNRRLSGIVDPDEEHNQLPSLSRTEKRSSDLLILQAGVLHMICALHSGQNAMKSHILTERVRLVDACHNLSLLSGGASPSNLQETSNSQNLDPSWFRRQSMLRTGLMIWLLDFLLACEFQCRPLMRLADAAVPLLCGEDIWESLTTSPNFDHKEPSMTLLEGLELLYMEKRLPPGISEFDKVLLVYGICRKTKEVLDEGESQLSTWTPSAKVQRRTHGAKVDETYPALTPKLSRWRNSACDCLDILHWSANSKAAASAGWEHPTILHLHLSRLILLTPLIHIKALATQATRITDDAEAKTTLKNARNHVLHWVLRDHFKARLSLIHAGAVFWHLRRYSNGVFIEPYAIYSATLVLWAHSISLQLLDDTAANNDASTVQGALSGTPVSPSSAASLVAQREVETEPSLVYLDRPCDDEMVQAYVRSGSRMTGYLSKVGDIKDARAPRRILEAGHELLSCGSGKALDTTQSIAHISPKRSNAGTWDIAQYFAGILYSVAQSSWEISKDDMG